MLFLSIIKFWHRSLLRLALTFILKVKTQFLVCDYFPDQEFSNFIAWVKSLSLFKYRFLAVAFPPHVFRLSEEWDLDAAGAFCGSLISGIWVVQCSLRFTTKHGAGASRAEKFLSAREPGGADCSQSESEEELGGADICDSESEQLLPTVPAGGTGELAMLRHLWEEDPLLRHDFEVKIRGSLGWTLIHKGRESDAINSVCVEKVECREGKVKPKEWCEGMGIRKSFRCEIPFFDRAVAACLCRAWCSKMQYVYALYLSRPAGSSYTPWTDAERGNWTPPAEFLALYSGAQPQILKRIQQIEALFR